MNFVTWSIRNPIPVIMMFIVLVFGGLIAFPKLQIQQQPDISFPFVFVNISYAGVPPSQMETEITRKVEDSVSTIVGIEHISSNVSTGLSQTNIQFEFGTDLQQAMDDVRDALTRIRPDLPIDATEPFISRATTAGNAIIAFGVRSANMSDTELSWFVDLNVMRAISGVPGVGQVNRIGGVSREVRVDLDPDRMAALGVTAGEVSGQLLRTQVELPGGETRIGAQEQSVRTLGTISTVQELGALQIALGGDRNVRLDSIADVRDQAAETRQVALLDGKPVIGFQVMRAWGEGALQVADRTREAVRQLQARYPQIQITELYSEVENIRESYHSSMWMLVEGAVLAVMVVWFFLRDMRATIISALALPLAIIPTFWALYVFHFTMNMLTMLALSLVVGMLVDDAIVEVENNVRHLRMGKPPLQAATDAAIEIGLAVVATTLTLCAVFVPVAFMDGIPGQFFKPFAFTATVAVLFSLLVARMLTPMLASRYMRPYHEPEMPGRIKDWYLEKVRWTMSHRWQTLLAVSVVMIATFVLASRLPAGLSPSGDSGFLNLSVKLPPGTRLEDTLDVVEQARTRIRSRTDVKSVWAVVNVGNANIGITLVDRKHRKLKQMAIQREVLEQVRDIPGARISAFSNNFGSGALQIELTGDDSSLLGAAAAEVERDLRQVPGFTNVSTSASLLQPELVIRPRADRAAELGVTTAAISQATRIATSGDVSNNLAKMNLPDRQIPIRVRLNDAARSSIDQIKLLNVPSQFGPVPLVNVADVTLGSGPAQITRYDRSRNITLTADRGLIPLGDAIRLANNLPSMQNLPPGVHPVEAGEAEAQAKIFRGFALAMITGIFCIYALLVLLFHDVVQPVTILSALPPSAGGAIVMLWLLRMDFSIPSLIGMLMLMGIVTKNSILLVEYAVMARREHGLPRAEALMDACSKRARPIVMTTIAMAAGMLPVTFSLSGDSGFRAPMGAAVLGGLFASTALSLFVVPVIYTLMDDFEHRVKDRLTRLMRRLRVTTQPA
jgi:multidrug efflux pump subunit AcrB